MTITEMRFNIRKDGVDTNWKVAILYSNEETKRDKIHRLMLDYPEEEGYELILSGIKKRETD